MRRIVNVLALTILVSALFALPASAQALVASASANTQAGPPPLQVQFSGSASGGQAPYFYSWNFGDGSNPTTLQNPGHTFSAMGTYTVTLTVTDIDLETATDTLTIAVSEALAVVPSASVTSGPAPLGVRFSSAVTGGVPPYTYFWDFRDGYSDQEDPWFVFENPGVYGVQLRVTDSQGAYAYGNLTITVSTGQTCLAWQAETSSTQRDIWGMTYGDGRFMGAAWGALVSSPNGTSWSVVHDDVVYDMNDVAYNGQVWVAVGNVNQTATAGKLLSSTDGVTWYEGQVDGSSTLRGITWGNGLFVAVGNAGGIFVSPDGAEWQKVHFEYGDKALIDVIWSEEQHKFVAVGFTGAVRTSSDGYIWENHDWPLTLHFYSVAWNGERYVAVGFIGSSPVGGQVYTSPDGEAWEFRGSWFVPGLYKVVWTGTRFVTVGHLDRSWGGIFSSRDGMTWVDFSQGLGAIPQLLCIASDGDELVAAGYRGSLIHNSGTAGCLLAEPTVTPQTGVAPITVQFAANVTGGTPPYRYRWSFGDGSADAFVENPSHTYAQSGEFTATLHAIDANDLGVQTDVFVRPVEPLSATQVNASPTTGMAPLTVNFSAGASGGILPYVYTWDFGDGSPEERGAQVSHLYAEGGSYQARVTIQDTSGLTLVSDPITVVVERIPCTLTSCAATVPAWGVTGSPASFSANVVSSGCVGAPSFAWTFGDGGTSSLQNPTHAYSAPGTYSWSVTMTHEDKACTREGTIRVTTCSVTCSAAAPPLALAGAPAAFQSSATASGGCVEQIRYFWQFGDGGTSTEQNPAHTYAAVGIYDWSFTASADGATCTQTGTVDVQECRVTCAATVPDDGVAGREVTFESTGGMSGVCSQAIRFDWAFGDGYTHVGQNSGHIYSSPGTYHWTLTATVDGVTCVKEGDITIYTPLTIQVTAYPDTGSTPFLTELWADVSGGKPAEEYPYYDCTWDFGDGTSASPYEGYLKTYSSSGTFIVKVKAKDQIGQEIEGTVTVFVIGGPPCSTGVPRQGEAATEESQIRAAQPIRPDRAQIMGSALRGGRSEAESNVSDPNYVCLTVTLAAVPPVGQAPLETELVATVQGGTPPYRYYFSNGEPDEPWYYGHPGPIFPHTYEANGTYRAKVMVVDADFHPFTVETVVYVADPISITVSATNTLGTTPVYVLFGSSVSGGVEPYTYAWDFDDGTSSSEESPTHLYLVGGNYTVRLTITDAIGQFAVSDPLHLQFEQGLVAIASASPTRGTVPLAVSFLGSALGGARPYSYYWDFGDNASSAQEDPAHTYATVGTYEAKLRVTDGQGRTQTSEPITIYVNEPLSITATANPVLGPRPLAVQFAATHTGGMAPYEVTWDFGDGTAGAGTSVQHTYTADGLYRVTAKVVDGAGVTATDAHLSIGVASPPAITLSAVPLTGSEPLTVDFSVATTGGLLPFTFTWDFGDGSISTGPASLSHTYAQHGTYAAKVTAKDQIGQTAEAEVEIVVGGTQPQFLWRFTADTSLVHIPTVGPDGSVYAAGSNAHIYGISPSGQQMWKKKPGGTVMAPMAFYRGNLYFPTSNQRLMAYASGGAKLWEVKLEANATSSPAISECGDVYLGATDGHLYAAGGGGGLKWKLKTAGPIESTPAVAHDGIIFVVANGSSVPGYAATLYAVRSSGGIWWEYPDLLVSPVRQPIVLDSEDNIYVTDSAGVTTVVPPTKTTPPPYPRSVLWQASWGPNSPVIAGGLALYSDAGSTKAVVIADGTESPWSAPYGAAIAPAVSADGKAYVVQNNGGGEAYLVSLDMADGAELSTSKLSGGGRDPVLLSLNRKGRVYLIAADYNVECYGVPRGAATGPWVQYGGTPFHPARRSQSPTAFITNPADGSAVSGSVAVQFGGTVDQACDGPKIHLYVEGYRLTTADASPAGFTWLTGASQNGNYTLTAECWDKAGNVAEASVNVSLSNPEPPTYRPADPVPTFSWQAQGDTKFRVYLSTDPEFGTILATSKTDQKPWLKSPGWTPSQKKWNKVLATAGSSPVRVYWKAIGKTAGLVHLGSFYVAH